MKYRNAERVVRGQEAMEGAGVRIRRTLGTSALDYLDPFLLLDEFKSDDGADYIAGFPDHPHRGFETVTYMLEGSMRHQDHEGNEGLLGPGSVQWMTAGRGIVHSEMPMQKDGLMWGFQLWVNLPARDKMTAPRYQDIPRDAIPEVEGEAGVRVRVIAGTALGKTGPVSGIATNPLYLDVAVPSGKEYAHEIPAGHNAFAYVYEGEGDVGGESIASGELAVLSRNGDAARITAPEEPIRLLVIAAKPLDEPMARYGPFVMNTREEIQQAFEDYRRGTFLD
jgi:hypothetical protein